MRSVLPWSFSSYSAYQTCPRQFYEVKIAKNWVEEQSEAILWGNTVHKAFEDNIKDGTPLPPTVQRFERVLDSYKRLPGETYTEIELAFTKDLTPTGFWDEDAYCRGKGDLVKVNRNKSANIDWKTGKVKPNSLQLDLMAVQIFIKFPQVELSNNIFVWLQQPSKPTIEVRRRKELLQLLAQFEAGVQDMEWSEVHGTWPEKPSGLCRGWCPVKSCRHWKPKR